MVAVGVLTDDLAPPPRPGLDLRPIARPHLEALVANAGETAHLARLEGTDVVFLDGVECDATVRATDRTGRRVPARR